MSFLTSERSPLPKSSTLPRLVPAIKPERERRSLSRLTLAIVSLINFAVGFGLAFLSRPAVQVAEAKIQIADFRIEIPDGKTTVTVLSSESNAKELARLDIQRNGDTFIGVPEVERHIEPRARLSSDDVAFFRKEMTGVFS